MTHTPLPNDLQHIASMLDAVDADIRELTHCLSEAQGAWRATVDSWSVAECLDHLATANRVYLAAMAPAVAHARAHARWRVSPAVPGIVGRWFISTLEPPVRPRLKGTAPAAITPRVAPPLADALTAFFDSQMAVRHFVQDNADLDLAGTLFRNPFVALVHFSLATGLHVIAAHERRHVWQAWNVRTSSERAAAA